MSHELMAITHHSIGLVQWDKDFQTVLLADKQVGTQDLIVSAFLHLEWSINTFT